MRNGRFHIIYFTLLLTGIYRIPASAQVDLTNMNLNWRYDVRDSYQLKYRISRDDSVNHIYFSINLPPDIDIQKEFNIQYEMRPSLDAGEILLTRTINPLVQGAGTDAVSRFFHIQVPDADNLNVFVLRIRNQTSDEEFYYSIPIVSETLFSPPDFMIFNEKTGNPECRDYINISDRLLIKNLMGSPGDFFIFYYAEDFEVADPPMYRLNKSVSRSMQIDSTFLLPEGEVFAPGKEGLYFIQSDTSDMEGIAIRVEDNFYPKFTSIEKLAESTVYLSTRDEIEELTGAEDLRPAFESFWLNLAKTEQMARRIIRRYYDRVEEANILFTNYKEGWKTDMGMIYIIIGPPDEVYINEERESWYYKNPGKNQIVVFNFLHLKNLFSDNHFMLIRDNQYKSYWFKQVDQWRKGIY